MTDVRVEVYVEGHWCPLGVLVSSPYVVGDLGGMIVRHPDLGEIQVVPRSFPYRCMAA